MEIRQNITTNMYHDISDKLFMSFGAGLAGAFTFWLGIVVLERGLRRFGAQIKLPYNRVNVIINGVRLT